MLFFLKLIQDHSNVPVQMCDHRRICGQGFGLPGITSERLGSVLFKDAFPVLIEIQGKGVIGNGQGGVGDLGWKIQEKRAVAVLINKRQVLHLS
jgi:hypothetical protein